MGEMINNHKELTRREVSLLMIKEAKRQYINAICLRSINLYVESTIM